MISKVVAGFALVLGTAVGLAAPAAADPAFNQLQCSCQAPTPDRSPFAEEHINRGLQDAQGR
ncbi:hypothetical protein MAAFP003_3427 [Mycobacterium ahvazicum]|uniref:Uncharacterized protein n=1 Tax=Mycobacterium ahvazicum TaxID=1964395 RepID=A0A2K4YD86_9MYCO|nr:hypothetical protein [Mycobacterium ahvazicum]SOX54749.1 hypothetical protein MAAFP003_3427 [Mycobacterium ahvazicum]